MTTMLHRPLLAATLLLAPAAVIPGSAGAAPGAWSPLALDGALSDAGARELQGSWDVRRAELGYLYALPAFLHFRQRFGWLVGYQQATGDKGDPFGKFLLLRQPTSPRTQDPSPNNDTLYGATFVDLAASPVVLSVPDVPGRYYSVALLDASFYNFEYVGSRTTGQRAGHYLIAGPGWNGQVPRGIARVLRAPTNSINLYQRIYFKDASDVPAVQALQDQITIRPLATFLDPKAKAPVPDPAKVLAVNPYQVSDPVRMLEVTNRYLAENPPPESDRALCEHFAPVGIGPGLSVPADEAGRAVLREGAAMAHRTLSAMSVAGLRVENGWQIPPLNVARRGGAGGTALQALTQVRTIGSNVPEEAVYFTTYTDGAGRPLRAGQRYVMRFEKGRLPPVLREKFGFWSVTMMHRENYLLVDNAADKYVVRSGDPLVTDADGSITIRIQAEPPAGPGLRANWLPAPSSGEFTLNLRVYLPAAEVLGGRWAPPPLTVAN